MSFMCGVLVFGDLLLDVLLYVEGGVGLDRRAHVVRRAVVSPGGAAGNVAVALSRLGTPARVLSAVGADTVGDHLLLRLAGEGVDVGYVRRLGGSPTGITVGFVEPGGYRTLFTYRGASEENVVGAEEVAPLLRGVCLVFISGFTVHNRDRGGSVVSLAAEASRRGIPVAIDLGGFTREHRRLLPELRGRVSYVLLNEEELLEVTEAGSIEEGLEELRGATEPKAIFLKRGERGCIVREGGTVTAVPAYRVNVVDTTGCGDAFDAGVLHGVLRGYGAVDAARLGSLLAAYKSTGYGAQHLPRSLDKLLSFERSLKGLRGCFVVDVQGLGL